MATVNFSVPDELKKEFQEMFADENKSAIIADLMRRAIEERRLVEVRKASTQRLLAIRARLKPTTAEEIRRAREEGRP